MDRYGAVERFEFVKHLYDHSENAGFAKKYSEEDGDGVLVCKFDPIRLCGVVMFGNYAYVSNNVFLGKVRIEDGIDFKGLFWDYESPDDDNRIKRDSGYKTCLSPVAKDGKNQRALFYDYETGVVSVPEYVGFLKDNIKALNSNFFKWRDYCIEVAGRDIISFFLDLFGKGYQKKKVHFCEVVITGRKSVSIMVRQKNARAKNMGLEGTYGPFTARISPETYKKWESAPASFSVPCYELDTIVKAMHDFESLTFTYDNDSDTSVVIKGSNRGDKSPDIRFALAQYAKNNTSESRWQSGQT